MGRTKILGGAMAALAPPSDATTYDSRREILTDFIPRSLSNFLPRYIARATRAIHRRSSFEISELCT